MAPEYVTELFDIYRPPRVLRSATELRLCERRVNLKSAEGRSAGGRSAGDRSAGGRSFSIVAPKLFNSLPNDLR